MKRFTSVIVFLALAIASYAQFNLPDYLISFGASGDTNVVGTIQVVNISDPDTVYLNGGEVLHLIGWGVGIQNPEKQSDMQIYPNPMTDKSTLKFIGSGNTNISIIDMCGKSLYTTDKFLQYGLHTFTINGVKQGMYLVRVSGKNFNYSTKLLSNSFFENDINISYTSFEPQTGGSKLKNSQTTVEMTYENGELLQYKGTTGTYTNFIMDRPNKSKTLTFNFLKCLDINGHNYATVQIAVNSKKSPMDTTMQIWMAENLNVGTFRTSGQGFHQDTIVEKFCYGNDQDNCNIYGGLYSWDEAMAYDTTEGAQGICPDDWHIPTDAEWNELVVSFGGSWQVINPWLSIDTIAGGYMKETSFNHWTDPNTGATNSSGFTALPGGMWVKDGGSYYCNINLNANFYTSKRYFNSQNWTGYTLSFEHISTWIWRGMTDNRDALSIRCIHD